MIIIFGVIVVFVVLVLFGMLKSSAMRDKEYKQIFQNYVKNKENI